MRKVIFVFSVLSIQIGWAQSNISVVGNLPEPLRETSGLLYYNGRLLTHNDSGNSAELFEFDAETLTITRVIELINTVNTDWEGMAQDDDFIYIGDFGNNRGERQDLRVLRISKQALDNSDEVMAERIDFTYEDQTDFTPSENSDFDAEAFFVLNNSLIILTKQWQQQGTVAYRIPKTPGSYTAERLASYQVNGLVTDATYDSVSNTLFLVGYSNLLLPFFVEIGPVSENAIFGDSQNKTNLSVGQAQMEAITLHGGVFYVTSEAFSNPPIVDSPSRLFSFTLDDGANGPPTEGIPQDDLIVFKSFGSTQLEYSLNTDRPIFGMGIFDGMGRLVEFTPLERISDSPIDISQLAVGLYYLSFFYQDTSISAPFFRN
ncbi:hypothetical protein FGF1_37160 [Flavobacteriaceae bacterium GF1]